MSTGINPATEESVGKAVKTMEKLRAVCYNYLLVDFVYFVVAPHSNFTT